MLTSRIHSIQGTKGEKKIYQRDEKCEIWFVEGIVSAIDDDDDIFNNEYK